MTDYFVTNNTDRQKAHIAIDEQPFPFKMGLTDRDKRSVEQNRLMWMWMNEAADQLKEYTATEYQAYCKLHFGVPILRGEDENFREDYDNVLRPLTYEQKLKVMGPPISVPITSLMTTKQLTRFLDDVYAHFKNLNVWLTEPDDG